MASRVFQSSARAAAGAAFKGLLAAVVSASAGQAFPPQAVQETADRLAAVVEGEVITLSDLEWLIRYKGIEKPPEKDWQAFRVEILSQLVNEKLIALEARRTPGIELTPEEIDAQLQIYRRQFPNEQAYAEKLNELGMEEADLRALIKRQLSVFRFLQIRFLPFIIILPDEIALYYAKEVAPELEQQNQPVPPLDLVSENIRDILTLRKTNQEVDRWVAERRRNAEVAILLGRPHPGAPNLPGPLLDKVRIGPIK